MEAKLKQYDGGEYLLPPLLSWEVILTGGVPCDSFSLLCPYDPSTMAPILEKVYRLTLYEQETVLRAVVDEYEIIQDHRGQLLSLSGRGLMALLLDNEAEAVEYLQPTLSALLKYHVAPYGIKWKIDTDLYGREMYAVANGSSQWKALSDFTRYTGGYEPRITETGYLQVMPWKDDGTRLSISRHTPIMKLSWKERRYGVYSSVVVIDKVNKSQRNVENQAFLSRGGSCRRVLYTPGRSTGAAMRYTGEYQIAQSKKHTRQLCVVMPGKFWAKPGCVVRMERDDIGITGDFYVEELRASCGEQGEQTTLTMRRLEED